MHSVFIFGNQDLEIDSLPIRILPLLKQALPEHSFTILDPNEEWNVPRNMTVIDTVMGIEKVTVFDNLASFLKTPRVTCHDFDAYSNLQFLFKLKKIDSVRILGVPPHLKETEVIKALTL
jgi:hypothetical protein